MKKCWNNPQLTNLLINKTNDNEVTPYFYWPWSPACDDAANNSGDKCPKVLRPCKYYKFGKCTVSPVVQS